MRFGDIKNQKNDVFSFAVASIFHNFAWKCPTRSSGALIDLKQIRIMHIGVFCSANADIDPDFSNSPVSSVSGWAATATCWCSEDAISD